MNSCCFSPLASSVITHHELKVFVNYYSHKNVKFNLYGLFESCFRLKVNSKMDADKIFVIISLGMPINSKKYFSLI